METQRKPPTDHTESNPNDLTAEEGIRQGLEDVRLGRVQPIREFFAEFEAKYGISHD